GLGSSSRSSVKRGGNSSLDLAALELRVLRKRSEPRLGRVAEGPDRRTRVGEQEPRSLLVVAEHVGGPVGPPREGLRTQPRLESLHGRADLEPRNAAGERHTHDRLFGWPRIAF